MSWSEGVGDGSRDREREREPGQGVGDGSRDREREREPGQGEDELGSAVAHNTSQEVGSPTGSKLSWLNSMAWTLEPRRAWSKLVMSTVLVLYSAMVRADTNFSFPPAFPYQNDTSTLQIPTGSDAVYSNTEGSYRMNPDSVASGTRRNTSCARVLYKDKVQMIDKVTRRVASFNTSFTFSFESAYNESAPSCGDGMVFSFYQANSIDVQNSRSGGSFCVHNFTQPHERQFSVEIDSFMNSIPSNDISDSHIGVNFGNENVSSRYDLCDNTAGHCTTEFDLCTNTSIDTTALNRTGFQATKCAYFCKNKSRNYTLWIDYDGEGHTLEVRFTDESLSTGTPKPAKALITVPNLRLNEFLNDTIEMYYVGFTASTGFVREVHVLRSWEFATTGMPHTTAAVGNSSNRNRVSVIAGVCAAALTVAVVTLGFLWFVYKKRRTRRRPLKNQELVSFLGASDGLRTFTYREISSSTKNFSASEFLSGGAFGDVYRGVLPSGALVAVKRIKENDGRGEESFLAEARSLTQIRHRNLLQLRGWSHNQEELFLVYDYMSNGSLDKWIYQSEPDRVLSWDARRFILAGVAAGLEYLHTGWVQCVLHRDIKASNVLLDEDFNAYVGDFGLARLIDHHKLEKTTLLAGTLGYMAPEMQFTGRATKETDVYAFGILVLEVVCGRRPLNVQLTDHPGDIVLLESVWRAHEAGNILKVADTRLFESKPDGETSRLFESKPDDVDRMMIVNVLHLGLLCCLPYPSERPSMCMVSQWFQACELVGTMELPPLPASKPYLHVSDYATISHESSAADGGSSISQWSGSSSVSALPTSPSADHLFTRRNLMNREDDIR